MSTSGPPSVGLRKLKRRRRAVADRLYREIRAKLLVPLKAAELRRILLAFADRALQFLLSPSPADAPEEIGEMLVRLGLANPQGLRITQEVLITELTAGLDAEEALVLSPRLLALLAGIANRFLTNSFESALNSQESPHRACAEAIEARERELLHSQKQLEKKVKQRDSAIRKLRETQKSLRKRERDLGMQARSLRETNTAIKVLMDKRMQDKEDFQERLLRNLKDLVEPYLRKLEESALNEKQTVYLRVLEHNLTNILAEFPFRVNSRRLNLTPAELQVASLVREGKTSREIAALYRLSKRTVEVHRDHIREKLGIKNKKTNLRTFLLSIE